MTLMRWLIFGLGTGLGVVCAVLSFFIVVVFLDELMKRRP